MGTHLQVAINDLALSTIKALEDDLHRKVYLVGIEYISRDDTRLHYHIYEWNSKAAIDCSGQSASQQTLSLFWEQMDRVRDKVLAPIHVAGYERGYLIIMPPPGHAEYSWRDADRELIECAVAVLEAAIGK